MATPRYELRVRGRVSGDLLTDFPGLDVTVEPVESRLFGPVRDQVELTNLIAALQDLGLEVVEVRQLPD
jgi:hypothetical protein